MQTRRRKGAGDPPPQAAPPSPNEDAPQQGTLGDEVTETKPKLEKPVASFGVAWGNIVTDSLRITDPAGLARRLREELELGAEKRSSYGHLLEAIDKSATNVEAAGRLHRAAKLEEENYTLLVGERLEVLRSTALKELMDEYKAKQRPSPTLKDIEDRMLASWPEEYRTTQGRIAELHAAVRTLEGLRDAWVSRCADLRIMTGQARPTH